jgi:hypothetical protein
MDDSVSAKDRAIKFKDMLVKLDNLTNIGYKFQGCKHVASQGPAGESYEILLSGNSGVSVEFTFYPAFGDKGDYVVIYIINNKTDKDFSLDSWLQSRGAFTHESPFRLNSYGDVYDQQLIEFLKFVNALLNEAELKTVLEGKNWIDMEFNWGNIK